MDDEDEFEETDIEFIPTRPLSRLDPLVFALSSFAEITKVLSQIADSASALLAMHDNYGRARQQLAQDAALEIETMTQGGAE